MGGHLRPNEMSSRNRDETGEFRPCRRRGSRAVEAGEGAVGLKGKGSGEQQDRSKGGKLSRLVTKRRWEDKKQEKKGRPPPGGAAAGFQKRESKGAPFQSYFEPSLPVIMGRVYDQFEGEGERATKFTPGGP